MYPQLFSVFPSVLILTAAKPSEKGSAPSNLGSIAQSPFLSMNPHFLSSIHATANPSEKEEELSYLIGITNSPFVLIKPELTI